MSNKLLADQFLGYCGERIFLHFILVVCLKLLGQSFESAQKFGNSNGSSCSPCERLLELKTRSGFFFHLLIIHVFVHGGRARLSSRRGGHNVRLRRDVFWLWWLECVGWMANDCLSHLLHYGAEEVNCREDVKHWEYFFGFVVKVEFEHEARCTRDCPKAASLGK
jgi:hypothetical protein